jgi:hypothetical protein
MKRSDGKHTRSSGRNALPYSLTDAALSDRQKLNILRSSIQLIKKHIKDKKIRSSFTDLIRLIKMESEVSERVTPRKITVYWKDIDQLDPPTTPSGPAAPSRVYDGELAEIPFPKE